MNRDSAMRRPGNGIADEIVGAAVTLLIIGGLIYFFVFKGGSCEKEKEKTGSGSPAEIAKPDLPIVLSLRNSLVGKGKVAIFSNQSSNRLSIRVTFRSVQGGQGKSWIIDLDPNGKEEFGWAEGWQLVSGETVTIEHAKYKTQTWTVP